MTLYEYKYPNAHKYAKIIRYVPEGALGEGVVSRYDKVENILRIDRALLETLPDLYQLTVLHSYDRELVVGYDI